MTCPKNGSPLYVSPKTTNGADLYRISHPALDASEIFDRVRLLELHSDTGWTSLSAKFLH
jgi:hypothetical protein